MLSEEMVGKVVNKCNKERCIEELVASECIEEVKNNRKKRYREWYQIKREKYKYLEN